MTDDTAAIDFLRVQFAGLHDRLDRIERRLEIADAMA